MMVLYMAITGVATSVIGYKSLPEVDVYCLFWHQLFQFANLWLILYVPQHFKLIANVRSQLTFCAFLLKLLGLEGVSSTS
jgi:hypothetical protein